MRFVLSTIRFSHNTSEYWSKIGTWNQANSLKLMKFYLIDNKQLVKLFYQEFVCIEVPISRDYLCLIKHFISILRTRALKVFMLKFAIYSSLKISNICSARYDLNFHHLTNLMRLNRFEIRFSSLKFINIWLANKVLIWKRNTSAHICKKQNNYYP